MPAPEPLNHLALIRNGLQPRAFAPKKVIIVGAGMAEGRQDDPAFSP